MIKCLLVNVTQYVANKVIKVIAIIVMKLSNDSKSPDYNFTLLKKNKRRIYTIEDIISREQLTN